MTEMVERVALAIKAEIGRAFDAQPLPGPVGADDWSATGGVLNLEDVARAAIAAMREPTEAMAFAAQAHGDVNEATSAIVWRAMIVEALS